MTHPDPEYPLSDLALARRLEAAEGSANAAFVASRARLQPEVGATWKEVAGTLVMFDGVGSPLTQTFGLGTLGEATDAALGEIEGFMHERGAEVFHEVSPMAGMPLLDVLASRGYRPVELTSVMHRPTTIPVPGAETQVRVRRVEPGEVDVWADTAARGWGETPELAEFMRAFGTITATAEGAVPFLAEVEGEPVATGALAMHGGVALLAGASTVPAARKQGAQRALLQARLRFAAEHGCDLAMMGAEPGSASQRNAERQGFRIAYTRIKWHLPPAEK
ncbi:GNAT family N-acetyltransferase [Longimicrobium sp.]|jgi:GNAT superfamily N-acetyltransferase|uniref:GNAT family N-acetyltransferase n=1 Tax=Longimicrobium sp. TaxID=2029185 RepID=UPI002F92D782